MKKALVKYIQRFSYPHSVYISAIKPFINHIEKTILIDAPCGNGATSWCLSAIKSLEVFGYDISEESIQTAKDSFSRSNLYYYVADIHNVISKHEDMQYFCIINSLFLLPEPDKILEKLRGALNKEGKLFLVVPNIHTNNFKWFQKNYPEVNKFTIADSEFGDYFSSRGWHVQKISSIVYARTFNRKDVKFFFVFAPLYLKALNFVQTILKIGKPNYFMLVLNKSN
ncbi:MAG TPA: methyltransferase domain-containing protein [Bacteroidia bacterium]|jgi:SAM-dependent methyltransferase|nr:methyltransferase domain-containing protein [Bacteroidia bacterium]